MCCHNSSGLIPCQQPTIITTRRVNTTDDTRVCSLSHFSGLVFFHSLLSALVSIFILSHPIYLRLRCLLHPGGCENCPPVQTGPGALQASCTMGTGSFLGVKRPRRGVDHPPSSSVQVKERVELYLYSPYGPSWPVLG